METYLIYIGKSALAAGAFYLAYFVLFQNEKQFVFNRIYLPVSLALSFIIPFITFTKIQFTEALPANSLVNSAFLTSLPEATQNIHFTFQWFHYLIGIYLLGIAAFLFHLLLGHVKALSIIRYSRIVKLFKTDVNITQKDVHPFSFFNKIVLSEKTLHNSSLEIIVSHENIHVKEKHTLDILFAEILFLFQWFNPFAWLLKDAIKNNLEYKTDHQIAKTWNPKTYQLAMVELADKEGIAPFLTALNGSQLKNRIIMMKKKTENKYAFVKQLVVLPLLAILIMGLANREIKTEIIQPNEKSGIEISGKVSNEVGAAIPGVAVLVKGKTVGTITNLDGNYKLQLEKQGETLVFAMKDYETQETTTNEKSSVINVLLKMNKVAKLKEAEKKPLIIIDGETFAGEKAEINNENIERIDVLKDESATNRYGAKGENGVILITTKEAALEKGTVTNGEIPLASSMVDPKTAKRKNSKELFYFAEEMPEFPGGESALKNWISNNINYPAKAMQENIEGLTYVSFVIKSNGKVKDPKIEKGTYPLLDAEALRLVNNLPDWKPGKQRGKNVDVLYTIPVSFEIPENSIITTPLELRKFIAKNIKYPLIARQANREEEVLLFAEVNNTGKITAINEKSSESKITLDEVVVTGYKSKEPFATGYGSKEEADNARKIEEQSLIDEVKRVINKMPEIEIPDFKGKTIEIKVQFVLQ